MLKYIHDKALFYGLLHGVFVEWFVAYFSIRLLERRTKHLQRFVLGRSRESIVVRILHHFTSLNDGSKAVF